LFYILYPAVFFPRLPLEAGDTMCIFSPAAVKRPDTMCIFSLAAVKRPDTMCIFSPAVVKRPDTMCIPYLRNLKKKKTGKMFAESICLTMGDNSYTVSRFPMFHESGCFCYVRRMRRENPVHYFIIFHVE
jgi:hypothetical protein